MRLSPLKRSGTWINAFYIYVSLVTLATGVMMTRLSKKWIVSDWLINYQGGFVRRGLPGEVAYRLSHLLHVTPVFFAAMFYLGVYAVLIAAIWRLSLDSSRNYWIFALILSPASLSFQMLHPQAGFRKETMVLAALSLLLILLRKLDMSSRLIASYLFLVFVLGTLSHEGFFLYAPYFFAALVLGGRSGAVALRIFVLPAVAGLLVFALCTTHLGNIDTATKICSSLGYKLVVAGDGTNQICAAGAIGYLRKTRAEAGDEALEIIEQSHYVSIYSAFLLLALVPAVGESIVLARLGMERSVLVIWSAAALSFLATLVLFRYGVDWGRWICVHIVSMTLLLVFLDGERRSRPLNAPEVGAAKVGRKQIVCGAFLFAYSTLWILPNGGEPLRLGYIGRFLYLAHKGSHPAAASINTSE